MGKAEITALNLITSLVLEFFESQAEQRQPTTLAQFLLKMRDLVRLDGRPLKKPGYPGTVSREQADDWAADQIRKYKARMRIEKEADGERALGQIAAAVKTKPKASKKKTD